MSHSSVYHHCPGAPSSSLSFHCLHSCLHQLIDGLLCATALVATHVDCVLWGHWIGYGACMYFWSHQRMNLKKGCGFCSCRNLRYLPRGRLRHHSGVVDGPRPNPSLDCSKNTEYQKNASKIAPAGSRNHEQFIFCNIQILCASHCLAISPTTFAISIPGYIFRARMRSLSFHQVFPLARSHPLIVWL
jgi:hypothetical protein